MIVPPATIINSNGGGMSCAVACVSCISFRHERTVVVLEMGVDWFVYPRFHDIFGAVVHAATLVVVLTSESRRDSFLGDNSVGPILLLFQEAVALVAHACYVVLRFREKLSDDKRNPYKWIEYSVSATAGTIAALTLAGDTPEWYWVTFVALTGAGQQFIGYQIDVDTSKRYLIDEVIAASFILAAGLQVGEFIVVWAHDRPPYGVLLPYVVMWSLFGVHAGLRLLALTNDGRFVKWKSTRWVEAGYSCLSWMAKLVVFWTAYASRCCADSVVNHVASWSAVVVFVVIVAFLTIGRTTPKTKAAQSNLLLGI